MRLRIYVACEAMVTTLVTYAKRDDPNFQAFAQGQFDSFLGQLSPEKPGTANMAILARAAFASMLKGTRLERELAAMSAKPLTTNHSPCVDEDRERRETDALYRFKAEWAMLRRPKYTGRTFEFGGRAVGQAR